MSRNMNRVIRIMLLTVLMSSAAGAQNDLAAPATLASSDGSGTWYSGRTEMAR